MLKATVVVAGLAVATAVNGACPAGAGLTGCAFCCISDGTTVVDGTNSVECCADDQDCAFDGVSKNLCAVRSAPPVPAPVAGPVVAPTPAPDPAINACEVECFHEVWTPGSMYSSLYEDSCQKRHDSLYADKKANEKDEDRLISCCLDNCADALTPCDWAGGAEWDYSTHGACGPKFWHEQYPSCGGDMQSPIDIYDKKALKTSRKTLPDLTRTDIVYDVTAVECQILVQPNYMVIFPITTGGQFLLGGGPFGSKSYELTHVEMDFQPIHRIDGKNEAMEINFFHKTTRPADGSEGSDYPYNYPGGQATLAVPVERKNTNNTEFAKIIDALEALAGDGLTVPTVTLDFTKLYARDWDSRYYTYEGSDTMPPCYETNTWLMTYKMAECTKKQIKDLVRLAAATTTENDFTGMSGFRGLRPVGNRAMQSQGLREVSKNF